MSQIPTVRKCKTHYFESDRLAFIGVVLYEFVAIRQELLFRIKPGLILPPSDSRLLR